MDQLLAVISPTSAAGIVLLSFAVTGINLVLAFVIAVIVAVDDWEGDGK